jgi:hypothetical protein
MGQSYFAAKISLSIIYYNDREQEKMIFVNFNPTKLVAKRFLQNAVNSRKNDENICSWRFL